MIRLHVEFAMIDRRVDYVIDWTLGWLYRHGYAFSYQEYDYRGGWSVDVYTKGLEPVVDMFEFAVGGFGDAFRYFIDELDAEVEAVIVCDASGSECVDVQFGDLKRLEEQEHLEVEERWQRMIEPIIYEDDDPEHREYEEEVRFERAMELRNDGDMINAALEEGGYE